MERLAAKMGGTVKWPYNESECLDADFFKIVADHLVKESGVRPLLHCFAVEAIMDKDTIKVYYFVIYTLNVVRIHLHSLMDESSIMDLMDDSSVNF